MTILRSVYPTEVTRTMHTITIRFRRNYFSDENGAVLGYSIIVGEDYTKNTEGDKFLPGWWEVQKYSTWPPYQVMDPYDPFNNNSVEVEDFIIGQDECKVVYATPKCNGKLKPGTIYRIKVMLLFMKFLTKSSRQSMSHEVTFLTTLLALRKAITSFL